MTAVDASPGAVEVCREGTGWQVEHHDVDDLPGHGVVLRRR